MEGIQSSQMRREYPKVSWFHLVWQKDHISRCSFFCWLTCRNRLRTKDRFFRCVVIDNSSCVLCGLEAENRDHLFFQYVFSQAVWIEVLCRLDLIYHCNNWAYELELTGRRIKGDRLVARIGRIAFNAVVYCVRQGEK